MLLDMFAVGANEKNIDMIFECDPDVPSEVIIDDQRVKQVLLNLL